jgi:hypothetical protein
MDDAARIHNEYFRTPLPPFALYTLTLFSPLCKVRQVWLQ